MRRLVTVGTMWGVAVWTMACAFDPSGIAPTGALADAQVTTAHDSAPGAPDGQAAAPDALAAVDAAPGTPDAPVGTPDAAGPGGADAAPSCSAPVLGAVGAACQSDGQCAGPNAACLDGADGWPADGYCTRLCSSDSACGSDARCSDPLGTTATRLCLATCCASDQCALSYQACGTAVGAATIGFDACVPATSTAIDGEPCETFGDCAPSSVCNNDPFIAPGGYCSTVGCNPGFNSTCAPGGDGICVDDNLLDSVPAFCLDSCNGNGDCRQDAGYQCESIGFGAKACLFPHRDVGEGCNNDADCGGAPWECLKGGNFPGGYCSASGCTDTAECPSDSFCGQVTLESYCIKNCDPGGNDCRSGEGYECIDFGGIVAGCMLRP